MAQLSYFMVLSEKKSGGQAVCVGVGDIVAIKDVAMMFPSRNHVMNYAIIHGHTNVVMDQIKVGVNVNEATSNGATALILAVLYGNMDVMSELIKTGANINHRDTTGMTALMLAVINGNIDAVSELIKTGADIHLADNQGVNALMFAIYHKNIAAERLLREAGATVLKILSDGNTPLFDCKHSAF
jgi:ankyrin repeat protein